MIVGLFGFYSLVCGYTCGDWACCVDLLGCLFGNLLVLVVGSCWFCIVGFWVLLWVCIWWFVELLILFCCVGVVFMSVFVLIGGLVF